MIRANASVDVDEQSHKSDQMMVGRFSTRPAIWWCVGALTAVNLLLALIHLTTRSLWLDEATSWLVASQHFPRLMTYGGGNMVDYYGALHWVIVIFGSSPLWLRLPSSIAGAATIPILFLLGRRCGGNRVGLFAATLGSVSLPLIFWSQNARAYSLGAFFVCLSALAFIRAIETKNPADMALWVIASVLACYTLLVAVIVVCSLAVSLVFRPKGSTPWRRVAMSLTIVAVADIPIAYLAITGGTGALSWIPPASLSEFNSVVTSLASGGVFSQAGWPEVIMIALWLGIAGSLVWTLRRRGRSVSTWHTALVVCWLVIPLALVLVVSSVQPLLINRYLLVSLPAGILLAAIALDRLRPPLGLVILAVLVVARLVALPSEYSSSFENFRDAYNVVFTNERPGDCISFSVPQTLSSYAYYLDQRGGATALDATPRHVFPRLATTVDPVVIFHQLAVANRPEWLRPTPSVVKSQTADCARLWYVGSYKPVGDARVSAKTAEGRLITQLSTIYRSQMERSYPGLTLYLFDGGHEHAFGTRP